MNNGTPSSSTNPIMNSPAASSFATNSERPIKQETFQLSPETIDTLNHIQTIVKPMSPPSGEAVQVTCIWSGLTRTFANGQTQQLIYLTIKGHILGQPIQNLPDIPPVFMEGKVNSIRICLEDLLKETHLTYGITSKEKDRYILIPLEAVDTFRANNLSAISSNNEKRTNIKTGNKN